VRPEERVMFCMVDDVELLTGILGAMLAGAVAVPVSTMVTGLELGRVLADSRARVLCVSGEFAGQSVTALGLAPEVTDVVLDRADAAGFAVRTHDWSSLDGSFPSGQTWEDSPALKFKEKKYVYRGMVFGGGLFLIGVSFCYFVLMPLALTASVQFSEWLGFNVTFWRAEDYTSFVCKFILGMGLGFELPVVILILVKLGILNYD